jgi:hypothetical protein
MSLPRSVLVLVAAVGLLAPREASAQSIAWTETSMFGYGLLAGGAALAICLDACDVDAGIIPAVGIPLVFGMVIGHRIGAGAERTARQGGWPRPAQLWAARVGMVATCAGVGALFAGLRTNYEGGNGPGDDERMIRNYGLIGAGLGVVAEVVQERTLGGGRSSSFEVSRRPTGALGVGLKIEL